ncbi:YraN family protein [Corynebacterium sp.]|uniref:YraN family protein n=1 Tax=Corynebacterium sp. TaxID=1720 RepID=UPI00198B8A56|nr:YraN family protein [Corynebacterium sp.]HHU66667.1 YraN family protein [Corynebacterium sp.]
MSTMQRRRSRLGRLGESEAAQFYRRRGAEVLARNVAYPVGELDLVCREPDGTIVFVEVKTRSGRGFGGAEAVTGRKLARIRRAATRWLEGRGYVAVRFDVLVLTTTGHGFDVEFYEGVEHGAR